MHPINVKRKATFITFYSFKGGVGRTMSLLNAASILAARDRRVLMIDFDLEAPGLTVLARKDPSLRDSRPSAGLVELIDDFLKDPQNSPVSNPDDAASFLPGDFADSCFPNGKEGIDVAASDESLSPHRKYACRLRIPEHLKPFGNGLLDLMPCGDLDGDFASRFRSLNFSQLYSEGIGQPFFLRLKEIIQESGRYDYVLIDSRTGFSDEGGICTQDLADYIVILTGLNHQNVDGTCRFLDRLKANNRPREQVFFVASPVPTFYEELREKRLLQAQKSFQAAGYETDLSLRIPYHPRLALDEEPFEYIWVDTDLFKAYENIQRLLRDMAQDTPQVWGSRAIDEIKEGRFDEGLQLLREVRLESPDVAATLLSYIEARLIYTVPNLPENADSFFDLWREISFNDAEVECSYGKVLIKRGDYEQAYAQLDYCLDLATRTRDSQSVAATHFILGDLHRLQGHNQEALEVYHKALSAAEEFGDLRMAANIILATGHVHRLLGAYDKAEKAFDSALQLFEEIQERGLAAVARTALGKIMEAHGQFENAMRVYREAQIVFQARGEPGNLAITLLSQGDVRYSRNDYKAAEEAYQEAFNIFTEIGDDLSVAMTRGYIGRVKVILGEVEKGLQALKSSNTALEALGAVTFLAAGRVKHADALRQAEQIQIAITYLQEYWDFIIQYAAADQCAAAHLLRAQLRFAIEDPNGAGEDAEWALEFYQANGLSNPLAQKASELLNLLKP